MNIAYKLLKLVLIGSIISIISIKSIFTLNSLNVSIIISTILVIILWYLITYIFCSVFKVSRPYRTALIIVGSGILMTIVMFLILLFYNWLSIDIPGISV